MLHIRWWWLLVTLIVLMAVFSVAYLLLPAKSFMEVVTNQDANANWVDAVYMSVSTQTLLGLGGTIVPRNAVAKFLVSAQALTTLFILAFARVALVTDDGRKA